MLHRVTVRVNTNIILLTSTTCNWWAFISLLISWSWILPCTDIAGYSCFNRCYLLSVTKCVCYLVEVRFKEVEFTQRLYFIGYLPHCDKQKGVLSNVWHWTLAVIDWWYCKADAAGIRWQTAAVLAIKAPWTLLIQLLTRLGPVIDKDAAAEWLSNILTRTDMRFHTMQPLLSFLPSEV